MKKICIAGIFPRVSRNTGSVSVNSELLRRLAKRPDLKVCAFSPLFPGEKPIEEDLPLVYVPTPFFRSRGLGDLYAQYVFNRYVSRELLTKEFDLLHADDNPSLALRCGVPSLLFLHGSGVFKGSFSHGVLHPYSRLCSSWTAWNEWRACYSSSAGSICVNSEFSRQSLISDYNLPPPISDKILPIKLGYNVERFALGAKSKEESRRLLAKHFLIEIDNSSRILLFIGGIATHKGQYELVSVLSRILTKDPQVHLLLVGKDAGDMIRCKKLSQRLGIEKHISFLGSLDDAMTGHCITASDIYASCAMEGFGINQLEAMAAGLPLIALDRGAVHELFTHTVSGLLAANIDELVAHIFTLLSNQELAVSIGKNGQKHAETKYSWDLFVEEMVRLYSKIVHP